MGPSCVIFTVYEIFTLYTRPTSGVNDTNLTVCYVFTHYQVEQWCNQQISICFQSWFCSNFRSFLKYYSHKRLPIISLLWKAPLSSAHEIDEQILKACSLAREQKRFEVPANIWLDLEGWCRKHRNVSFKHPLLGVKSFDIALKQTLLQLMGHCLGKLKANAQRPLRTNHFMHIYKTTQEDCVIFSLIFASKWCFVTFILFLWHWIRMKIEKILVFLLKRNLKLFDSTSKEDKRA